MLKKTVTYEDYNGVTRTESFWFNLTKAELAEMEMGVQGGMVEMLQKIIDAKDNVSLFKYWKDMVIKAYGVKSEDGRRIIKNDAVREEFIQTEAYSIIFMELATNTKAATDFVIGIMPKELQEQAKQEMAKQLATTN